MSEPEPERPPLGSWPRTYAAVLIFHFAWLAVLLWVTLRWQHGGSR